MHLILLQITIPLLLGLFHLIGPVPADLGADGGHLSPCESPAHCASATWRVSDSAAALRQLSQTVENTPRAEIVQQSNNYLHATYSSRIFGFVDDLELVASDEFTVEARSISRLGESDLGVNAQRLASLERSLESQ